MLFDMPTFSRFAHTAYMRATQSGYELFSFEDTLAVFRLYFEHYEHSRSKAHPNIRLEQIQNIIEAMPYVDNSFRARASSIVTDLDPGYYDAIIPQHFETKYRNCDYNINHFFSGDIRLLRLYETCY
ncbi:hypothetical protein LJC60_05500 [Ruminococcaceae bacterium OttesenSCG-928-D13]|nr:hypothetical protein [Ruminococcaceae bacterium OttesenSCG-928-D13]